MSEDSRPKENLLVTTPSERPPSITRRDFLRIIGSSFGFLVGASLYELRTGNLGELTRSAINFLVSKEVLEEGNPAQRAAVLEKILRVASLKSGLDRKNYGEEVIVPWFKLNLVEQFGQAANYHLAAKLLRHFLYGRGTPVDITSDYIQETIEISHNLFPSLSEDEALERFTLGELDHLGDSHLMKPGDAKLASSIEEFKEAVADRKPYHLKLLAQSYSLEGAGADKIKFALGSYGIIVGG